MKQFNYNEFYDSKEFKFKYTYNGNDLGAKIKGGKTYFRLWAPLSDDVTLNIYKYGHPTSLGNEKYPGDDVPFKTYEMKKSIKGTWNIVVNENLSGFYYTYTINNQGDIINDIVDPYAKAIGLNGLRGCIVDFSITNPKGWIKDYKRQYKINELIIYELHIRDITMDHSWNGPEHLRGTYLGVTYPGTTYTKKGITVTTGFDHIKELGVNAVQILPIYDQANDELSDIFNWGYNPQNYNALEGQYSTNPYDAITRIKEFKEMCLAFHNAGIEVIMDVVYNHMNCIADSSFDKIVPGYYFRYKDDNTPSNGSDCGNETASDRPMYQKYMIDSVIFWATEYNLAGYRFDLMGIHDIKTMNKLASKLHEIDPNIKVYGEPWLGGASTLKPIYRSVTKNYKKLKNVGIFNDVIRDAVKGSVFQTTEGAWIQGEGSVRNIASNMNGCYFEDPTKQVNYVSCHDNNTLADKLTLTKVSKSKLADADIVAQGIVLLSEGVTFMLQGEEILRSKPVKLDNGKIELSHNSYNLPDSTNSTKWNEKIKNLDVFNKYKSLIEINKKHPIFHYSTVEECKYYNVVKEYSDKSQIVVEISKAPGVIDEWNKVVLLFTNNRVNGKKINYELKEEYKVEFVSGNNSLKVGEVVSGQIILGEYSLVVLAK